MRIAMSRILLALVAFVPMFMVQTLHAAEEAPQPSREQGMTQTIIMIALALVFFYLILWRPEKKRRKAAEDLRSSIKKGDRVSAVGIIGQVVDVQENTVILKMYDGSKIEVWKAAINEVLPETPSKTEGK